MDDLDDAVAIWAERIGAFADTLPEATRQPAWVGTRWQVRGTSFAHVAPIVDGRPPSFAEAADTDGPAVCLTFYIDGPELDALANIGMPFFKPRWSRTVVGLLLDEATDLDELRELLTESYCTRAPKRLAARVERPDLD